IGRPMGYTGPPITIYEEVFADIVDDLDHLSDLPDNEDILAEIGKFTTNSLKIYDSNSECSSAVYSLVGSLLGVDLVTKLIPPYVDVKSGVVACEQNNAIYLHIQSNNELGLGGIADVQGALTLLKEMAHSKACCVPSYIAIHHKTCCPCIHLFISGPYISFGGSILTNIYSFQSFTDYIYLGCDTFMTSKICDIARTFVIFRSALSKLQDKYCQLEYDKDTFITEDHSRLFPRPAYPDSPDMPNMQTLFIRCALFLAKYKGEPVVVKFSEKYNPTAHQALAIMELAPKLYFHTQLRGGVHMVIMELIDALDAVHEFPGKELPNDVVQDVEEALQKLHGMNLVHGDVRRPNILVKKGATRRSKGVTSVDPLSHDGYHTYLVDFDWVGRANIDWYTPLLNTGIPWPPGVRPGALMQKVHDDVMLEKI
ncbi:hypothetical protein OG21DRAFT_1380524, partial [Imleria badia]